MADCLIRKATCEDIEALRELYLALEEDAVRYQPEHFVIGERTDDFFQSIFDSENQDILVADINGNAIGFVHVMILQQKKTAGLIVYEKSRDFRTADFRSVWLLVFWGRLTIGGMILTPMTSHHMRPLPTAVDRILEKENEKTNC